MLCLGCPLLVHEEACDTLSDCGTPSICCDTRVPYSRKPWTAVPTRSVPAARGLHLMAQALAVTPSARVSLTTRQHPPAPILPTRLAASRLPLRPPPAPRPCLPHPRLTHPVECGPTSLWCRSPALGLPHQLRRHRTRRERAPCPVLAWAAALVWALALVALTPEVLV